MKPSIRLFSLCTLTLLASALPAQKLKVYILAGQSNMEGHAKVSTLGYIADDPKTAPLYEAMCDADGKPRVCDDVFISYFTGGRRGMGEGVGKLTAGFGSRRNPKEDGGKIGPEFTFGIHVGKASKGPVLLIKTAWGGKSLHTDFRSPSAGPYPFREGQAEQIAKRRKKSVDEVKAAKVAATGRFYKLMIDHVKHVLGDIERVVPSYDAKQGYEIAGFAWFQGWNDMVDRGTYPSRDKPGGYDAYSECMAHFIRDVRKDLGVPDLPFVIGVMGVGGPIDPEDAKKRRVHANFRAAMAAPASLPEFQGNVTAVATAPFWDARLQAISEKMGKVNHMRRMLRRKNKKHANKDGTMTEKDIKLYLANYRKEVVGEEDEATYRRGASNAAYHYLGCGKTMALIGRAFAQAMLAMEGKRGG